VAAMPSVRRSAMVLTGLRALAWRHHRNAPLTLRASMYDPSLSLQMSGQSGQGRQMHLKAMPTRSRQLPS
jgi:hypothetical protein